MAERFAHHTLDTVRVWDLWVSAAASGLDVAPAANEFEAAWVLDGLRAGRASVVLTLTRDPAARLVAFCDAGQSWHLVDTAVDRDWGTPGALAAALADALLRAPRVASCVEFAPPDPDGGRL